MARPLIFDYLNDGACPAAKAVLAYLQGALGDGIESSWDQKYHRYAARPEISRWENCREQGYVVSMRSGDHSGDQVNIAWFEHRNSDEIHAIMWEQTTINAPMIETAKFGNIYKDKFDTSHSVSWNEAHLMAEWIANILKAHWKEIPVK